MAAEFGGYEEFVAELYDVTYSNRKDIDFFIEYSKKANGATLELGCGTGRVLIPTALSGSKITGIEISTSMLAICQKKLSKQSRKVQGRVKLIHGNMIDFHTDEMYSLVTTPFRSFQHLISVEEQKACLYCINKHLYNHGLLILDVQHIIGPSMHHLTYMQECEYAGQLKLPDGRNLRCTTRISAFHRDQQYNDNEIIYYISDTSGRTERFVQAFPMRYFFRYEIEHLLRICGFKVIEIFGNYDRSRYSNSSPEMIFIAEKD